MARGAGHYRRFTADEKARMNELRSRGLSYKRIAQETGDDIERVRGWFRLSRESIENPSGVANAKRDRNLAAIALPWVTKDRLMAGR